MQNVEIRSYDISEIGRKSSAKLPETKEKGFVLDLQEKRAQKRAIVQYDLQFDTDAAFDLLQLRSKDRALYEQKKEEQKGYIEFNVQTAIGERFNAGLSNRRDEIIRGEICDSNLKQPLLQMIRKGAEYRAKNGSSLSDQKREHAEVIGFEKIQTKLTSRFTDVGTMMVSISPPGGNDSMYKHNFYDVFTLEEDKQGRYIDVRRYSSGLGLDEWKEKIDTLRPDYFQDEHEKAVFDDVAFLSEPIVLSKSIGSADFLHEQLHTEHAFMNTKHYQELVKLCQPFIHAYVETILSNPFDIAQRDLRFNAVLNRADEIATQLENGIVIHDVFVYATQSEIDRLGNKPVRVVTTGCGLSGGAGETMTNMYGSPMSVIEFATSKDQFGALEFECPGCYQKIMRPFGKLLQNCTNCGTNKVAC